MSKTDFNKALAKTLAHEGGYVHDPDDRGGETYRGVARAHFPIWEGWDIVDRLKGAQNASQALSEDIELGVLVETFYREEFWDRIKGSEMMDQRVAEAIFDFAVNAGVHTASKLAQQVIGATSDGAIGPQTLSRLSAYPVELFLAEYKLAKIARYVEICESREANRKFFYGWVRRALA